MVNLTRSFLRDMPYLAPPFPNPSVIEAARNTADLTKPIELSLTVPIVNTLAFLFTVLGEWYVEGKVISRSKSLPHSINQDPMTT